MPEHYWMSERAAEPKGLYDERRSLFVGDRASLTTTHRVGDLYRQGMGRAPWQRAGGEDRYLLPEDAIDDLLTAALWVTKDELKRLEVKRDALAAAIAERKREVVQ